MTAIVAKLVEKARQGDVAAARLVLAYAIGKPAAAVDPDNHNMGAWQWGSAASTRPQHEFRRRAPRHRLSSASNEL